MTEDGNELGVEPGLDALTATRGRSLLDRIKSRRSETDDTLRLPVPSWNGELIAEYKVLDRTDIENMVKRIRARQSGQAGVKAKPDSVGADCDFLIKACGGIIAHDNETDEEEVLTNGFNSELTALLGNPDGVETARDLVLYLLKNNTVALASHSMKVARWMEDTSKPVDDPLS